MGSALTSRTSHAVSAKHGLRPFTDAQVAELRELAKSLAGRPLPNVHVTEQQFVDRYFHEDLNAEWVAGEVFVTPPANLDHNDLNIWLACLLREFVEHHDVGRVFAVEAQVRLANVPSRRNPDLFFVSTANLGKLRPTFFDGAPDLIVEIVSPDSASRDWREKFLEYEKSGVREYWLIDPASRQFEAYALGRKKKYARLPEDENGHIASKVLRGFSLKPAWLWQSPRAKIGALLKELGLR